MFALEVTEELETWPEQNNRARQWVCVSVMNKSLKNYTPLGEVHNSSFKLLNVLQLLNLHKYIAINLYFSTSHEA